MKGWNLSKNLFAAPLLDGRTIVTEQLTEYLLIIGAETVGQSQRLFAHAAKNNAATRDLKRANQRIDEGCEVISLTQLLVFEQIGASLNHSGRHAGRLRFSHHLFGRPGSRPLVHDD